MDYRQLNRVTVRKVFLIPNSDYIKSCVAGSDLISVGDLKEGFNQCDNTEEALQKMAVLATSGSYLPKGLTFGPTNGPEDFQELMFTCFSRRLYQDWYLFLDDLAVATGGRAAIPTRVSEVKDYWCLSQEADLAGPGQPRVGVGKFDPRLPSPYAQIQPHVGIGKFDPRLPSPYAQIVIVVWTWGGDFQPELDGAEPGAGTAAG